MNEPNESTIILIDDPETEKVLEAFEGPQNEMRTPGGIARDTGLPLDKVKTILTQHPSWFVPATTIAPSGSPVFLRNVRVHRDERRSYIVRQQRRSPRVANAGSS